MHKTHNKQLKIEDLFDPLYEEDLFNTMYEDESEEYENNKQQEEN
jgi:hypothetical protein